MNQVSRSNLNPGYASVDVGSPQLSGYANPVDGGWDIVAGGVDIWEKEDQFHYVYSELRGDFDVAVRIENFTPAHLYSKAGLMIRESLTSDSPHLMLVAFSNNEPRNNNLGAYEMQYRSKAGEDCKAIYPAVLPPAPPEFPAAYPNTWLRVVRAGNLFTAYGSTDGATWKEYAQHSMNLSSIVKVGPALTSHDPEIQAKASFREYRCSQG